MTYLASDRLKGRVNHTTEQAEVAEFLSGEFLKYGLKPFPGLFSYYMPFSPQGGTLRVKEDLIWNGRLVNDSLYFSQSRHIRSKAKSLSDYLFIQAAAPLADSLLYNLWTMNENVLLWIKPGDSLSFAQAFDRLKTPSSAPLSDILIAGLPDEPLEIRVTQQEELEKLLLFNVIGMIPGRSLAEEVIIFSAHYDHIDKDLKGETGGIFNGANDNASGVATVLAMAKYYSQRKENERTLLFCLFSGEELGLLGSKQFVKVVDPAVIKAVINIEMIGRTNTHGNNSFFITGSGNSDLENIMIKNLKGNKVRIRQYGSDNTRLFERSDNYPFFQKGIPAHSIMCSDDKEPCYHQPCDDANRIDFRNITEIIRAIVKGSESLISGRDTPVSKTK